MKLIIKVGCCGFRYAMDRYFQGFSLVEIQRTFYKLPNNKTISNWREKAHEKFEFTVKAWQAITHPITSPTWKQIRPLNINGSNIGLLRPTKEVFESWNRTVEACRVLRAEIVVVQTPASFRCTATNYRNAHRFFEAASKDEVKIAWEPRGDWLDNLNKINRLCEEFEIIHVVDLLRRKPAIITTECYTRLHGLNPREYDYKYRYSTDELNRLADILIELEDHNVKEVYVLFNNVGMVNDAIQFQKAIKHKGLAK